MNNKEQLEKLRKDLQWLLEQSIRTKQSFLLATDVFKIFKKNNALASYGDYFAYTQNMIIYNVLLQLSKLYDKNEDSISLQEIIEVANDLFNEKYYKESGFNSRKTYDELKYELDSLNTKLNGLSGSINNLKVLRDKNLAHFDKKIKSIENLVYIISSNPVHLNDVNSLIEFSVEILSAIKAIIFNVRPEIIYKDYTKELEKIAKAIEFYKENRNH